MINIKPTEFKITLDIDEANLLYNTINYSILYQLKEIDASDYDKVCVERIFENEFYLLKQLDIFLNIGAYDNILIIAQKEFERKK